MSQVINIAQRKRTKSDKGLSWIHHSESSCVDCRFFNQDDYSVNVCMRWGGHKAAPLMLDVCKGKFFEQRLPSFWKRLGDAIIERVRGVGNQ